MNFFREEQQKYISSSKLGVRNHPMIIRYCLGLAAKSRAFYDQIRVDDKKNSGFLVLPSRASLGTIIHPLQFLKFCYYQCYINGKRVAYWRKNVS